MNLPRITVVTPSFNQASYLEETIRSILNQRYPNLEYIIIDGGSTDGSVEIIRKYENQLAFWVSEKDGGLYDAIQKGFACSTGEIMTWINADDLHHPKSLFTVGEIFQHFKEVKWLMGANSFFNEAGQCFLYDDLNYTQRWSRRRLLMFDGKFIQQESVFWRRELWEEAGSYMARDYSLAADFELWLRFSRYQKLYTTSFLLAGFRFRSVNQKSYEQRDEYLKQVRNLLEKERKSGTTPAFYRFLVGLIKIVPKRKWRNKLLAKILQLPPKIIFDREKGMLLSSKNDF
ncbi:glycosyltransferase [Dyadobacter luticola]|uniref:Glycosyltransferase n=1 Tax=Dyadobacter luticola TaxID=1979387 RepID=A0A5R9L6H7_9BACT|nr:glycosyltransferase [Dyadobacter luticola]